MAERISTGARNWILALKRELFNDCVMKIYSGTSPASADDETSGTRLVTISKSSASVSTTERSTPGRWSVTIPGTHAEGTYAVNITTADSATATTCTYTTADPEGHADNNAIAKGLAREINEGCHQVFAIAEGANSKLYIQERVGGLDISTVADGGGTITITTFTEIEVAARCDALCFGLPASGSMSKSSDTWSGTVDTSGTAGYFRIVRPDDDGTESTTQKRLQGTISTSGSELNMSNTSLTATQPHTVDDYSLTEPAE